MAKHTYIDVYRAKIPLRATVIENLAGFQPVVIDDLDRWVKWSASVEDINRAWEIATKMRDDAMKQKTERVRSKQEQHG